MENPEAMRFFSTKPFILPPEMVQMLRGERGYTENSKDIAELAISYYQDGLAGLAYDPPGSAPGFSPWCVEMTERFLLASWEQGRKDAGEAQP